MAISPALFNLYMEKFMIDYKRSFENQDDIPEYYLYADDLVIITTFKNLQ